MRALVVGVAVLVAAGLTTGCHSGRSGNRVMAGVPAPTSPVVHCARPIDAAALVTAGVPAGDPTPGYEIDPPLTCHGNRDAVIGLDSLSPSNHVHVVTVTHGSDDDYFAADAYCADGFSQRLAEEGLLEHEPFLGEHLHTPRSIYVQARGLWTITIVDVATMPKLRAGNGTSYGHGDMVLVVSPGLANGRASYTFTHNGRSTFIVLAEDDHLYRTGTLINIIGPYSGRKAVPTGTKIITISADGDWTIT